MSRPEKDRPLTAEEMDRLVKTALEDEPEGDIRLDDEILLAYLTGDATQAQQDMVHEAISRSSSFRRRMVALARVRDEDLSTADSSAGTGAESDLVVPKAPSPAKLGVVLPPGGGESSIEEAPVPGRGWSFSRLLLSPVAALGLAVVLLAYPAYRLLAPPESGVTILSTKVPAFVPGTPGQRKRSTKPVKLVKLPVEAAALDLYLLLSPEINPEGPFEITVTFPDYSEFIPDQDLPVAAVGEDVYLNLILDRRDLIPGTMTIQLEAPRLHEPGSLQSYTYSLRIQISDGG